MKIIKAHVILEVPLMPGMEKKDETEIEKQNERFIRNALFSKLITVTDVTSKVIEKK